MVFAFNTGMCRTSVIVLAHVTQDCQGREQRLITRLADGHHFAMQGGTGPSKRVSVPHGFTADSFAPGLQVVIEAQGTVSFGSYFGKFLVGLLCTCWFNESLLA